MTTLSKNNEQEHYYLWSILARSELSLVNHNRVLEPKVDFLKEYFDLGGVPVTLKAFSLSHEHIKMEPIILSRGEEGFLLDKDASFL